MRLVQQVVSAAVAGGLAIGLLAGCSTTSGPAGQTRTVTVTPPAPAPSPSTAGAAPAPAVAVAAKPKPVNHCAHNTDDQRVIVSLRVQHMWLCAHRRTVYSNAITSGMLGQYTSTPTGDYTIQGRSTNTVLTLNTGETYPVRYWIPFDGPLFGFHDSNWQQFPYGSPKYKTEGSHGCIHMPLAAIAYLYRWSAAPTAVHIS